MAGKALRIFRKWNRIIHRDVGYFFFGMTLIYCISGIAINHRSNWNPNYSVINKEIKVSGLPEIEKIDRAVVMGILKDLEEEDNYKSHYFPSDNELKIFLHNNGTVMVNCETGLGYIEWLKKRPFLFELNFLHYNPGSWWTWFSDIFCVALILIAISGLFVIAKSKNSLTRRGIWFLIGGLILPILALILL